MSDVKFNGPPPPARGGGKALWLEELLSAAQARPGEWAQLESDTVNQARNRQIFLRRKGKELGLNMDVHVRGQVLYVRVMP